MNAVISGCAGVALIFEGKQTFSIHADALDVKRARQPWEIRLLFGEAKDLQYCKGIPLEEVKEQLREAVITDSALHLALCCMDDDLSADLRQEIAADLAQQLQSDRIRERLECILYARPLPGDADIEGALLYCEMASPDAMRSYAFFRELFELQPLIEEVHAAWEEIGTRHFGDTAQVNRVQVESAVAKAGLFRGLVLCLAEKQNVDAWMAAALMRPEVRAIQNHREILKAWIVPFQKPRVARSISTEMNEGRSFEEGESIQKDLKVQGGYDRLLSFEKVNRQKQDIERLMARGDEAAIWPRVEDLVGYQLRYGGPQFAVKSLCDLAVKAQSRGMYALQLRFTQKSVEIFPKDTWCWKQHGHALKNNGRYEDALLAYDRAGGELGDVVAKTGRAEVLKALGRYEEALKAYDEVTKAHPENVVAKNGRAEVLKALGRYEEALKAYDEVTKAHPSDVVAKTGRAELLKALGRYEEALKAYDEVTKAHPSDVVTKTGRAEVLKALGRYEEALKAYDEVTKAHPENVVAKNGLACVLAALKRWDDALKLLPPTLPTDNNNWIGYHIRGMILLRADRIEDAIQLLQSGLAACPLTQDKDYFRTALGSAHLRRSEYQAASAILADVQIPSLKPIANILQAHAAGAQGQHQKAKKYLQELPKPIPPNWSELVEAMLDEYGPREKKPRSERWKCDQEADILINA